MRQRQSTRATLDELTVPHARYHCKGRRDEAGRAADLSKATQLHAEIDALEPTVDATADWTVVMLIDLLGRLRELADLVPAIVAPRRQIRDEQPRLARLTFAGGEAVGTYHHRDHIMALHSALAAIFAIAAISAF